MDADQLVGVHGAEPRGDERAPVAALRGEARIAEHAGHQLGEAVGDRLRREARLPRLEREAVAGQRRSDDGEGVGRVAAEARRIGEAGDDLEELEHRARPAVREEERKGSRAPALDVEEVQVDPVQRHRELRKGIEPRFLRAPVELVRQ